MWSPPFVLPWGCFWQYMKKKGDSRGGESKTAGFFFYFDWEKAALHFGLMRLLLLGKLVISGSSVVDFSVWFLIIGPKMLFRNVFEIRLGFVFFIYVFKCCRVDFSSLNNSPENHCNCFIILSDLQCTEWIVYIACEVPDTSRRKNIEYLRDTVIECHTSVHLLEHSSC